jgi:hypothetical protein
LYTPFGRKKGGVSRNISFGRFFAAFGKYNFLFLIYIIYRFNHFFSYVLKKSNIEREFKTILKNII